MEYPIVQTKTIDNIWLYGLHLPSENRDIVLINVHGTASNFYEEYFIEVLARKLSSHQISLLSTNNRGAGVYDAYQKTGAAVEKFEDCLIDIDAWIEFVLHEGYQKIILSGHSLGTEKVVYYMNHGKYADKIGALILLAPSDSYGSHRMLSGKPNLRAEQIDSLLAEAQQLINERKGQVLLPQDAYGSYEGIMPKSAQSFVNFLGLESKLLEALPFHTNRLSAYSNIQIPILVAIGDQEEYTAIPIKDALELMKKENPHTQVFQITNCDHDFQEKEEELTEKILEFVLNHFKNQ
jgi:pimeloyl-ACP methyl ester carboxylesterase